jgi:arginine decarboxylase
MTEQESSDYAEDLAASMLASTLGIDLDADVAWNERGEVYKTSNLIVDTLSMTLAAEGAPHGWTCVVVAAVFRFAKP